MKIIVKGLTVKHMLAVFIGIVAIIEALRGGTVSALVSALLK